MVLLRSFIIYPPLAVAHIGMNLFVWVTAWFWALLSVVFGWDRLPDILENLQTIDNPLDSWTDIKYPNGANVFQRWWCRTYWLIRNPAQGFTLRVLGVPVKGTKTSILSQSVGTLSWDGRRTEYQYTKLIAANGREYFGFRMNWKITPSVYLKLWFGWMTHAYDGKNYQLRAEFQPKAST